MMLRANYIQVATLAVTLLLQVTDWRWFLSKSDSSDDDLELTHSQVYPTSLRQRARLLERIEAPPMPALPSENVFACLAHADCFVNELAVERPATVLPATDPLYAFMSLQR